MQRLSPKSLKNESDCHCTPRVFERYTSLTCVGFSPQSRKTESNHPRTTSPQLLDSAGKKNPCTQQVLKRINLQRNDMPSILTKPQKKPEKKSDHAFPSLLLIKKEKRKKKKEEKSRGGGLEMRLRNSHVTLKCWSI